jgi:hypothetical protein
LILPKISPCAWPEATLLPRFNAPTRESIVSLATAARDHHHVRIALLASLLACGLENDARAALMDVVVSKLSALNNG